MKPWSAEMRALVLTLIPLVLVACPAAAQELLAITPVTVVDVIDGSLHPEHTVLVENDRIPFCTGACAQSVQAR